MYLVINVLKHTQFPKYIWQQVSLAEAWWKFGSSSHLQQWDGQTVPPWHVNVDPAPLRMIPGGDTPERIRNDPAHCWAIGVGKEFAASCILLLCHLDVWPRSNIHDKLADAFEHFQAWRYAHKQACKLSEFSLKTFKIQSLLGLHWGLWLGFALGSYSNCLINYIFLNFWPCTWQPRLQQYPVLKGAGSDCVVICKWLGSLLQDDGMKPTFGEA